ncbi:MAG: nucleoside diphosphate kinase regulator [Steroidobacteraceae bacterium]
MNRRTIMITQTDMRRLRTLLTARSGTSAQDHAHLEDLKSELERAVVVDASDVSNDVVTMYSRVWLEDMTNGERREYTLVFPSDADLSVNRVSVLAPLGTALLGYREGDQVEWQMPGGLRKLRIMQVMQGPGARASYRNTQHVSTANATAAA